MADPGAECQSAPRDAGEVELEMADVLLFLLRLCDKLDIDPLQVAAGSWT